jgi:D-alanyl-D-alanine dipeptidase
MALAMLMLVATAHADQAPTTSSTRTMTEAGMIDIRELVPDIAENMHYAGNDNFVGSPIDGYGGARCYLLRPAAEALAKAERALRAQHRRLLIWDCYRPARAVRHFVRWAADIGDQRTKAEHYPHLDKRVLLGDYIAPVSGHSRGATVDLTLQQCDSDDKHCRPLDMGTDFDFFDPKAHTDSPLASAAQREHRHLLRSVMEQAGFRNYTLEWWHYTLTPEPSPTVIFDVPIH